LSDKKTRFCSHCGSSVKVDDTFCNNCGASLSETVDLDSTIPMHQPVSQAPISPHMAVVQPPRPKREFARASLIIGAIAFVISNIIFVRGVCLPFCLVAVIFGVISLIQKDKKQGFAIGGIILSVLALASFIVSLFYNWWYLIL